MQIIQRMFVYILLLKIIKKQLKNKKKNKKIKILKKVSIHILINKYPHSNIKFPSIN